MGGAEQKNRTILVCSVPVIHYLQNSMTVINFLKYKKMKTRLFTKQTTHLLAYTLLCALAITTVGCSKEEPNAPEESVKRITATATAPEGDLQTRVNHGMGGWLNWNEKDQIGVWMLNKEENYATFENTGGVSNTSEFTGELAGEEGDMLCAVYPPLPLKSGEIHFDATNQSGRLYEPNSPLFMYAMGTLTDNKVNFQFQHTEAMIEVGIHLFPDLDTKKATLTFSAIGLHTSATLKMTSEGAQLTINGDGTSRQQINISSLASPVLIRLFAGKLQDIQITVTDGTNTYEATLPDKEVFVGKIYAASDALVVVKK